MVPESGVVRLGHDPDGREDGVGPEGFRWRYQKKPGFLIISISSARMIFIRSGLRGLPARPRSSGGNLRVRDVVDRVRDVVDRRELLYSCSAGFSTPSWWHFLLHRTIVKSRSSFFIKLTDTSAHCRINDAAILDRRHKKNRPVFLAGFRQIPPFRSLSAKIHFSMIRVNTFFEPADRREVSLFQWVQAFE
jgi:hypothetical protein